MKQGTSTFEVMIGDRVPQRVRTLYSSDIQDIVRVEKYRIIAPQILRLLSTVVQVRTVLLLRVERRDPTTVLEQIALHSFAFRG